MALGPSLVPKTQQQKLTDELNQLESEINTLLVQHEKYFLGIDRRPPDDLRWRVSSKLRGLRASTVNNTGLRFRIDTLFAKLISFERMWDRTIREMEKGTYKRDVFKAKYRMARRGNDKTPEPTPAPAFEVPEEQLKRLYQTYLLARERTGESTAGITFDGIARKIRAQLPSLLEKHGARSVEFKVVIKGGKAVLKAIPRA